MSGFRTVVASTSRLLSHRRVSIAIGLLTLLLLRSPALAQPGSLDPTFGKQATDFAMGDEGIQGVELQADGKIVAVGCADCQAFGDWLVARFLPTGSLDPSFNGGWRTLDFAGFGQDTANDVALQTDGRVVVAGLAQLGFNQYDFAVARFSSGGLPDPTFDDDGWVTTDFGLGGDIDTAAEVAIQANGKIVVVGSAETASGRVFALARYEVDGALDPTFGGDGKVTTSFGGRGGNGSALVVRPNGKIVVVGTSRGDVAIARHLPDGRLDTSFSSDGRVITDLGGRDGGNDLAVQADGKYVVAGEAGPPSNRDFAVVRYLQGGGLDRTFSSDGKQRTNFLGETDQAFGVAIQSNGKIIVAGLVTVHERLDFGLARYRASGQSDLTFSGDGKLRTDFANSEDFAKDVMLRSGKILAGGWARTRSPVTSGFDYNFGLARYLTT
jgi:uncharacterized delta-60 repeat protein